jgi:hypothetical protein
MIIPNIKFKYGMIQAVGLVFLGEYFLQSKKEIAEQYSDCFLIFRLLKRKMTFRGLGSLCFSCWAGLCLLKIARTRCLMDFYDLRFDIVNDKIFYVLLDGLIGVRCNNL